MNCLLSQLRQGLALLLGLVLYFGTTAYAGSFSVSPVRVTLSAQQKVTSLTVTNQGTEATTIHLETLAWSQDEQGTDVFEPTKNILANPPVFKLEPNAKQVIRVGLRKPAVGNAEESYRLFLQEVPPPPKEGFNGLSVALRMSIPIFVLPKETIKTDMVWQLKSTNDGAVLTAINQGLGHIQVLSLELQPQNQAPFVNQNATRYLLPKQKNEWPINNKKLPVGLPVLLKAQTDVGLLQMQLVVE